MTRRARHVSNVAIEGRRRARSRPAAFLKLHEEETDVLGVMPAWMFKLFAALVKFSDFRTGYGSVQYWMLVSALAPIQPAHGGPRHETYSERQIRDALIRFESARILKRVTGDSERSGSIFFAVSKRTGNFAQPRVT